MHQQKLHQHSIFFIVVLFHIGVFFSWQYSARSLIKHDSQPNQTKLLSYIYLPTPNKIPSSKSTTPNLAKIPQKKIAIEPVKMKRSSTLLTSSPTQIVNEIESKTEEQTKPSIASEAMQRPLQRNIADLTQSLKVDFQQQEKRLKPKMDVIKQFGNAVADAAQIPREGVKIENKHTYDDRPVSKVITPYGTYCIRHRKAGESPDLVPPPIPVSCGRL